MRQQLPKHYALHLGKALNKWTVLWKVDKFFDCFNVSTFTQGKLSRKVFEIPYRQADNFRMKVEYMHNS